MEERGGGQGNVSVTRVEATSMQVGGLQIGGKAIAVEHLLVGTEQCRTCSHQEEAARNWVPDQGIGDAVESPRSQVMVDPTPSP